MEKDKLSIASLLTYLLTYAPLRNDLYCVESDVKLCYTIPYHTILTYEYERSTFFDY